MAGRKLSMEPHPKKIQAGIDYIEKQLNNQGKDGLLQDDIGKAIGLSGRRARELFKNYSPENLHELLERLKFEMAKRLLLYNDMTAADVADEAVYGDLSTLRKLIKKKYGLSVQKYRNKLLTAIKEKGFYIPSKETRTMPEGKMLAYRSNGDYNGHKPEDAWKELMKQVNACEIDLNGADWYGLLYDDTCITDPNFCRYDACLKLQHALPDNKKLRYIDFPSGEYLVFQYTGDYAGLEMVYESIFFSWDKRYICDIGKRPMIEHYIDDPQTAPAYKIVTEILIPIKKSSTKNFQPHE